MRTIPHTTGGVAPDKDEQKDSPFPIKGYVTQTTFWTYEQIDYGLLHDDIESADNISPLIIWRTKEEAKQAAEDEIRACVVQEILSIDNTSDVDQINWEEITINLVNNTKGLFWADCDDFERTEFRVYPVQLEF